MPKPPVRRPIAKAAAARIAPKPVARRAPAPKPVKKLVPGRYLPPIMGAPRGLYGGARYPIPPAVMRSVPTPQPATPDVPPLPAPVIGAPAPAAATPGVQPPTSPPALTTPLPTVGTAPPGPLSQNPQLPSVPSGAYTDAQFVQSESALRQQIMSQYNDVLAQLGYTSPEGQSIKGSVELEADRQQRELERQRSLAELGVTNQMQGAGTLYSGYRGAEQARQTQPMVSGLADIQLQLPRQLSQLYGDATGLLRQYEIERNQLLLDALSRRQQAAMEEV